MKKVEKSKTFKWYLNKVLLVITCLTPLVAIILIAVSYENNKTLMYISFGLFPFVSIISVPNTILYAIKESKKLESDFVPRKNSLDKKFLQEENKETYKSKILFATIRHFLFLILLTIVVLFIIFWRSGSYFATGGPERTRNRSVIRKILVKSRYVEGRAFLLFFGVVLFVIPILAYNITLFVCNIRAVLRRKYYIYNAKVSEIVNGTIHIIGKKDTDTYTLKSCKCIGISKKNLMDKNVIVIFILDKIYLIPKCL